MKKHIAKGLRVFLACLLAFVMIAGALPIRAAAAGELTVTPNVTAKTVRIEGDLSSLGAEQVSLIIMDPSYTGDGSDVFLQNDKIVALEQVALTGGKLDATLTLREIDPKKDYRVFINGAVATATFQFPLMVTGVSLNKNVLSLKSSVSETLVATVAPAGASNSAVTWESSDTDVASVDSTGKVFAKFPGSAVITVKTADGEFTDTCAVTVLPYMIYTVETGEILSVPITARDCDALSGMIASVVYDKDLLMLNSISPAKGFSVQQSGDKFVMLANGSGVSGDAIIAYAVFSAKPDLPEDQSIFVSFAITRSLNESLEEIEQTLPVVQVDITSVPPLAGDVNLDGEITLADAILLMQYVAGNSPLSSRQLKAADVNKDSAVNVGDVIIIMQMCL